MTGHNQGKSALSNFATLGEAHLSGLPLIVRQRDKKRVSDDRRRDKQRKRTSSCQMTPAHKVVWPKKISISKSTSQNVRRIGSDPGPRKRGRHMTCDGSMLRTSPDKSALMVQTSRNVGSKWPSAKAADQLINVACFYSQAYQCRCTM